ncbi:leukocyte receptor cluster member 1 homolog [Coccinella septempunctata]|uniref:leukocyte receptor cluster member 1 homolog n=1 Tax=Coccinella septempunctata TaxID=41139 RepID=UPI001D05D9B3|nr:leukocyte receptor cluster member 1 homolog [Coccinella septempunctata]
MNILPKKRWHVRNRDNIARVRKDEAKAEEERKAKEERQKLAEREARTVFLREKARERVGLKDFIPLSLTSSQSEPIGHINFFEELENGQEESKRTNKEHEKEKKEEAEKYEKQIGYLTYLGQDTNEALGKRNWYDEAPNRDSYEKEEVNIKSKLKEDPLEIMKKYMPSSFNRKKPSEVILSTKSDGIYDCPIKSKHKHKKKHHKRKRSESESDDSHKKRKKKTKHASGSVDSIQSKKKQLNVEELHSDDSDYLKKKKLELLRIERLKREKEEKLKTELLFSQIKTSSSTYSEPIRRKYNSQFNPEIARQNQLK